MILAAHNLDIFRLSRYEVHLRAQGEAALPPFLGSALRGAWGHALKAVSCSMPHGDCGQCLLVERCLYPKLFETSARSQPLRPECESANSASRDGAAVRGRGELLKHRQDAPRPFIFMPPLLGNENGFMRARDDLLRWRVRVSAGEAVVFGLSLIGDAISDLPYVIYAISLMAQHGFGAERASFALERVAVLDAQGNRTTIYTPESNRIAEHANCRTTLGALVQARLAALQVASCPLPIKRSAVAAAGAATVFGEPARTPLSESPRGALEPIIHSGQAAIVDEVTLRFLTPARLRLKGRVIENPTFAQLVSSVSLRLSMLAETFADAPLSYDYKTMIERAHEVTMRASTLRLMALDRYSNRQGGKLELDGFMGDVTFAGSAIEGLLPLLVAGEFLNLGSGTAFGLGRYRIVSVE